MANVRVEYQTTDDGFLMTQIIKKAFHQKKSVLIKSCDVDLVTETDQAVEKMLIERIKENFPDHKYI